MIPQANSACFSSQTASTVTSSTLSRLTSSFTENIANASASTVNPVSGNASAVNTNTSSSAAGRKDGDLLHRCASSGTIADGSVHPVGTSASSGSGRSNTDCLEIAATPTRILRGASAAVVAAVRTQSSPCLSPNGSDGTSSDSQSQGKPVRKLPVALKHGDLVFFVMCPEEEPKIAAELEDVQALSRVVVKETLPRAVCRKLTDDQIGWTPKEPYKRPEYYSHHSGEMLHEDLDSYVGYDMDSEDEQWLNSLNARMKPILEQQKQKQQHSDSGSSSNSAGMATTLSYDDFELIIDRLEKVAFRRDQNKHSTMRQIAIDEGTEGCCICGDGMSEDANQMIYCDGCDMAVHQQCYGVQYIPEGSWKCSRCLSTVPVKCCLCHERNPAHAIKQCVGGEWVHVICALWVPETTLRFIQGPGEIEYLDSIDVSTIPPERMQHLCSVCHMPGGACIKCSQDGCTNYFHPICAWQSHFHMKCTVPDTSSQLTDLLVPTMEKTKHITVPPAPCSLGVYKVLCPEHRPIQKGVPQKGNKKQKNGSTPSPSLSSPALTPPPVSPSSSASAVEESDSKSKAKRKGKKGNKGTEPTETDPASHEKMEAVKKAAKEADVYAGVKLSRVLVKMRNIDPRFVEAVHDYWVQKRIKRGHIPLMKEFDPSILMLSHPAIKRHPKATNDKAGYKKLRRLRYDMERTRNMLEVVRQRERMKLSLVENAQQQFDVNMKAARRFALSSLKRVKQSPSPTSDDEHSLLQELLMPTQSPSPCLSLSSQPCSDSEDLSPTMPQFSDKRMLPLSQLSTGITTQSDPEGDDDEDNAESAFSDGNDGGEDDSSGSNSNNVDDGDVFDSENSDFTEERKAASAAKSKQTTKGVKRSAEVPAPFLRLYFDSHESTVRSRSKSGHRVSANKQPQRSVIEVNPALRTELEDDFVPPPRGETWIVGTSNHSSALPVYTKRLSAKQRALCEKQQQQNASTRMAVTVLFPVNSGTVPQTGALPQPLVVKPTNKHILLSIVDRLHKLKHPAPSSTST